MLKPRQTILILAIITMGTARADSIEDACSGLWKKKPDIKKCTEHVKIFEVPVTFIKSCQDNFTDSEDRWNCVKSGATEANFKVCTNLKWSTANTLTCLRTLQNPATADSCNKFSKDEETQVTCMRLGRELAQISACSEWSSLDSEKIECLRMDIPAEEIRTCTKRSNKNTEAARKCLMSYVAKREENYERDMQEATREILAKQQVEKAEKANRSPASVKSE